MFVPLYDVYVHMQMHVACCMIVSPCFYVCLCELDFECLKNCKFLTQDGFTALTFAVESDRLDCARLLLEAGANTEAKDRVRIIIYCSKFHFYE